MDGANEGFSLAKTAVTALLVVLVIGAIVGLVYAAYSWFNSGTAKLGDQVNSISASAYSQYDDAQVTGTDVLTALKSYRDADIAIFISNKNTEPYAATPAASIKTYNYCALADSATANTEYQVNYDSNTGRFSVAALQWNSTSGLTERNTNFSPTTDKSNQNQYVRQGAQWYANLVYDESTNEVCGIIFREMVAS